MNSVTLTGRLVKDPEMIQSKSGNGFCPFTIAVDDYGKNGTVTSFIRCVAFGKLAENLVKFCKKGRMVGVEGRLSQQNYQTKEGKNASMVQVIVMRIEFFSAPAKEKKEMTKAKEEKENVIPKVVDDMPHSEKQMEDDLELQF